MRSPARRPPGVQMLEHAAADSMPEQLSATFDEWRMWTVDVLESHLSYPLLFYFRSSHDNEAWANSFGAVMDAATLVLSTVDEVPVGHARLMYKVGMHLVADMRYYFRYNDGRRARRGARGVLRGLPTTRAGRVSAARARTRPGRNSAAAHQVRVLAQRDDQVPGGSAGTLDR